MRVRLQIYASVDGLDMQNNDNGVVDINGPLDQNHVDADPTSFDQGVEKLETETDDRFLNWLYVSFSYTNFLLFDLFRMVGRLSLNFFYFTTDIRWKTIICV